METAALIKEFFTKHPPLAQLEGNFNEAVNTVIGCYNEGGKLLVCGNGGSSADADHIVGELMNKFECHRPLPTDLKEKLETISDEYGNLLVNRLGAGLPAISLSAHTAMVTAITNDIGGQYIFAQQVVGYGKANDILVAFTTSGNSENIIYACVAAKAMGLKTICFTGETGGKVRQFSDILINLPSRETAVIQEMTIPLYHLLCRVVERNLFGK